MENSKVSLASFIQCATESGCRMHKVKFFIYVTIAISLFLWSLFSSSLYDNYPKDVQNVDIEVSVPKIHRPMVIILTYMRSGSTLLGEIFKRHPNTIYLFEPFRVDELEFKGVSAADITHRRMKWIYNFSVCNFNDVLTTTNDPRIAMKKPKFSLEKSSLPVTESGNGVKSDAFVNSTQLTQKCFNSSTLPVIKSIRMNLVDYSDFVRLNEHVKIIHLIRDPRAVELSRRGMPHGAAEKMNALGANQVCDKLWKDIVESENLYQELGPKRIMRIAYEELILDQENVVRNLHKFANIEHDETTIQKFFDLTHADKKVEGGFHPNAARNASFNLIRWQHELPAKDVKEFEKRKSCKSIIQTIQSRIDKIQVPKL